jgi:uncharacterized protein YbaR (Trm112 family)
MNNDDLFSYLVATDQLDEFLGYKEIVKCPGCNTELLIYEDNILYCPNCEKFTRYNLNKKIYNKELTLEQKRIIDSKGD